MDQIGRFVANAVLGIDTLWGGDVMCPSGTGRFIADSWFSDEPLPAAYTTPAAARVRETGGVGGKTVDREAIEAYLREVDLPKAMDGMCGEADKIGGLRGLGAAVVACIENLCAANLLPLWPKQLSSAPRANIDFMPIKDAWASGSMN